VARFAERDRHQQPPERIAARQVELAPLLPQAEALVHALEHVLLVLAAADSPVQVVAGQLQQVAEVAPPDQPGGHVALDRVVGAEKLDQPSDRAVSDHGAHPRIERARGGSRRAYPPCPLTSSTLRPRTRQPPSDFLGSHSDGASPLRSITTGNLRLNSI